MKVKRYTRVANPTISLSVSTKIQNYLVPLISKNRKKETSCLTKLTSSTPPSFPKSPRDPKTKRRWRNNRKFLERRRKKMEDFRKDGEEKRRGEIRRLDQLYSVWKVDELFERRWISRSLPAVCVRKGEKISRVGSGEGRWTARGI